MPTRQDRFVHEENVCRFEKCLEAKTDLDKRSVLRKQLEHLPEAPRCKQPAQTGLAESM